jgi:hypothetical protein
MRSLHSRSAFQFAPVALDAFHPANPDRCFDISGLCGTNQTVLSSGNPTKPDQKVGLKNTLCLKPNF